MSAATPGSPARVWFRRLAIATIGGAVAVCAVPATSGAGSTSEPVRWLALGDSYSSGEGIPGANDPRCQRANGDGTNAKAYAVVAVEQLRQDDPRYDYEDPYFVACTGAITDDVVGQLEEMRRQVPTELQQWDVVSMTFGGNNIRFAQVIRGCLDVDALLLDSTPGCDVTSAQLQARIEMLAGLRAIERGDYAGSMTLPDLYDEVAPYVRPGGLVLVLGYPRLIEDAALWPRQTRRCQQIRHSDTALIRGAADRLNAAIRDAVSKANERHADSGITFQYIDVTDVYEPSDRPADRHLVCSQGDDWVNGVTLSVSSGDFRSNRSFHPNQRGHIAQAERVARAVKDHTAFHGPLIGNSPPTPEIFGWPVGDRAFGEGPSNYYMWLGADFFFPSWVSCSTEHCLAGDGREVVVTQLRPLDDLGRIPHDVADPFLELVKLGVPPGSATAALAPGEP